MRFALLLCLPLLGCTSDDTTTFTTSTTTGAGGHGGAGGAAGMGGEAGGGGSEPEPWGCITINQGSCVTNLPGYEQQCIMLGAMGIGPADPAPYFCEMPNSECVRSGFACGDALVWCCPKCHDIAEGECAATLDAYEQNCMGYKPRFCAYDAPNECTQGTMPMGCEQLTAEPVSCCPP
jgi:hypothetical protein